MELEEQYATAQENARSANDTAYKWLQDKNKYTNSQATQATYWNAKREAEEANAVLSQLESQMAEYDAIIEKYTNSAVETTKSGSQEQIAVEEQALDQRLSNIQSFSSQSTNTQKSMYDQQVSIAKQAYNGHQAKFTGYL